MSLLWMDNFVGEVGADSTYESVSLTYPQISPYLKLFNDSSQTSSIRGAYLGTLPTIAAIRNVAGTSLSARAYKLPYRDLPITFTAGVNLNRRVTVDSPGSGAHLALVAIREDGDPVVVFSIRSGQGDNSIPGILTYAEGGVRKVVEMPGTYVGSDPNIAYPLEFSFTKVANDSPDQMSNLTVWSNNLVVYSDDAFNNGYNIDQLALVFVGLIDPTLTDDHLEAGGISVLSETGGGAVANINGGTIGVAVSGLYVLDDTGTHNKERLGKTSIVTRVPNGVRDTGTPHLEPSTAAESADLDVPEIMRVAPVDPEIYAHGMPGALDDYTLTPVSAGLDIRAVKSVMAASKDDPFGYDVDPFFRSGAISYYNGAVPLTTQINYSYRIEEMEPTNDVEWTSARVNNTSVGIEVVD